MGILAGIAVVLSGVLGVALTLLGLSGAWLTVFVALLVEWQRPGTFDAWTLGVAIGLALLGEVVEFVAGAMGAAKAGGTKRAAIGATVGGVVGGVLGTPIAPIVGTILGAVAGAGLGAALLHHSRPEATLRDSWNVAKGAAGARLLATAVKGFLAVAIALLLGIAAFI